MQSLLSFINATQRKLVYWKMIGNLTMWETYRSLKTHVVLEEIPHKHGVKIGQREAKKGAYLWGVLEKLILEKIAP